MKSKKLILGIILSCGLIFGLIFGYYPAAHSQDAVSQDYTISILEPLVRQVGGKVYYEIKGFGANAVLGLPILPYKTYYFEIPFNAKDISVSLVNTASRSLGTISNLAVFQGVAPLDLEKPATRDLVATRALYKEATFPTQAFKYLGENGIKGHRLVSVGINPLILDLSTNELTFNDSYTIRIQYTLDPALSELDSRMRAKKSPVFEKTAQELIFNYQEPQALSAAGMAQIIGLIPVADIPIEYAIITLPGYSSYLQPLAEWKTKKGVPAKVYTTDWIEANYTGVDLQEKIRKFLTDDSPNPYYYSAKFDWLLIAGEQGAGYPEYNPPPEGLKLPARYMGPTTWLSGDTDMVPADYYFADCADASVTDYDWDTNNNGVYGELTDDIKWLPDTYVGRIPTYAPTLLTKVVNKIIDYEKNPAVGGWTKEAVLCGGKDDNYTDSALLMKFIKEDFLDSLSFSTYRLNYLNTYPKDADLTEANFVSYVSAGRSLVEWSAHGNELYAYSNPDDWEKFLQYTTNINDGAKRPVVYSSGCNNGKFDYYGTNPNPYHSVCLGDAALRGYGANYDYGIAFIGAARTVYYWIGWNSPNLGGCHGEQYRFNQQVFQQGKYHLGQALYDMKLQMVNDFDGNPTYDPDTVAAFRKNLFAMNLLGDPEMEIWTDTPKQFAVEYASEMYKGSSYLVVVKEGSVPVEGARVTLYKQGDAYGTGLTDAEGGINFNISVNSTGPMAITVTKHNYIPFEGTISVIEAPRNLTITSTAGGTTDPAPGVYSYAYGNSVDVTADPGDYYLLDHWELDSVNVGASNPYSVIMDTDHTLNAVFVEIPYICGDCNVDTRVNILDITYLINFLYKGGPAPLPVKEIGDVNSDTRVNILDATYLINFLYKGGAAPIGQPGVCKSPSK